MPAKLVLRCVITDAQGAAHRAQIVVLEIAQYHRIVVGLV